MSSRAFFANWVFLSAEKTIGPSTSLEFLGIVLDFVEMRASLPTDKLARIRSILGAFLSASSKCDVLSLLGHLNFAIRAIPQGHSFISRLLLLAHSVVTVHDVVSLHAGCWSDLRFWSLLPHQWS